jgi:cytosine/adenosine deaminase-related metal-dependent hydrolase
MSIQEPSDVAPDLAFKGVRMAGKVGKWDISCSKNGVIASLEEHKPLQVDEESGTRFLSPSLCHPHIHLDKCFLLSHPKYADLEVEKGDFAEAMKLTSRFISLILNFHLLYSRRFCKTTI